MSILIPLVGWQTFIAVLCRRTVFSWGDIRTHGAEGAAIFARNRMTRNAYDRTLTFSIEPPASDQQ